MAFSRIIQDTITEYEFNYSVNKNQIRYLPVNAYSTYILSAVSKVRSNVQYKVDNSDWIDLMPGQFTRELEPQYLLAVRSLGDNSQVKCIKLVSDYVAAQALTPNMPHSGTHFAVRASQALNGNLLDQGPNQLTFNNSGLLPTAWLANAPVALNEYRTSTLPDGRLYKCTVAGSNGATEPTWNTTIGGTTTSGGATYTTEKGPYFVDNSGVRLFRSIASSQIGAPGIHRAPRINWDMQLGQSLVWLGRIKFDYNASGQAAASPIFSTRELTGTNCGVRIVATGGSFNDLRFNVRDNLGNSILSDNFSTSFARKPLDGNERAVAMMIDGPFKMMWVYIEGLPLTQADMFSGTSICPNGMNLAAITGSTKGGEVTIGGDPLGTTSVECAFKTMDCHVINGPLPANTQNIASWHARGGEGVLPESLFA